MDLAERQAADIDSLELARVMRTSVGMILRHNGTLIEGAGAVV
ncbi:MAG TPA: hypothetical protein VK307_04910 [Thermoleophilaceae bacterium]|nr:hypothetical protein [Thermoleophilaceae bacterium]